MGRHSGPTDSAVRLSARVYGVVQGVGFRFRTMGKAEELGLTGVVENLTDGSVAVVAEGPEEQVSSLLDWLRSSHAPGRVERVDPSFTAAEGTFGEFSAR
ncbi:acylphosphatase [Pseudarthrobacter sp. NPDC058362]|uniref:acylphosphatase n=1 Tax=Pseudarthrobacter sp. NPDC058362 TaxID=3346458 RepID=UPI003652A091